MSCLPQGPQAAPTLTPTCSDQKQLLAPRLYLSQKASVRRDASSSAEGKRFPNLISVPILCSSHHLRPAPPPSPTVCRSPPFPAPKWTEGGEQISERRPRPPLESAIPRANGCDTLPSPCKNQAVSSLSPSLALPFQTPDRPGDLHS